MCLPTMTRLLLTTIVLHVVCQPVLRAQQVAEEEEEVVKVRGIHDIDLDTWQQSYTENQKLLVLLYTLDNCERCPAALETLTQVQEQELPKGLTIAKSASPELVTKIGAEQLPTLVYLRDKSYVIYDGNFATTDIAQWILTASKTIIRRLDDNSFEDIIPTAPGVGVEDWLLVFYREPCKNALTAVESFGVKAYGRIKIAKIVGPENPRLTLRFNVANCPEIILIKQGKVYKYPSEKVDMASLQDFVDNSYSKLKEETIADDTTDDNDFLDSVLTDFIKIHLRGDNQPIVVASLCAVVASLVFIFFCCCRPKTSRRPKKAKKE
ncbi:unnamed protein product [Candidula unifasciata]|uniref:Thioredoxin domain-containing protein n=1 Tax=Candidula unifasciata TaxID=100452 RepID=A0A8S3Z2K2_9EUPU|nr:unnamed protein product [Candidula unifasciata]